MPVTHVLRIPPVVYVLASLGGAAAVLVWRFRETASPVTVRKLIIPPLGMSTGLFMFVVPQTRVEWSWGLVAFIVGAVLFAWPLARTSTLTRSGDQILMQRSKAFLIILLVLVAIRFALRAWIEQYLTPMQTGALFFLLAFGAIVRWRLGLLWQFLRMREEPARLQP